MQIIQNVIPKLIRITVPILKKVYPIPSSNYQLNPKNPNKSKSRFGFNGRFELDLDLIRLGDLGDNILLLCLGEEFRFYGIIWFYKEIFDV